MENDTESFDWEKLLPQLLAYAIAKIRSDTRRPRTDGDVARLASDLVSDAVTKFLETPHVFDPDKASLFWFLRNTVRGEISNELRRKRNSTTTPLDAGVNYDIADSVVLDTVVQHKIDAERISKLVEEQLGADDICIDIFYYYYHEERKRSEIPDLVDITLAQYDAAMKRILRVFEKISIQLQKSES